MFLATIWAFLFPPINKRNSLEIYLPNEKTTLLKTSEQITSDSRKMKHSR